MARDSDAIELDIDGHPVRITSPGKVLFSERNETKLDLVNYYLEVGDSVMRTMGGRPVLMERYPHGAEGNSFFQKEGPSRYREVSDPIGVESYCPWGPSVGDFNADGYDDVLVGDYLATNSAGDVEAGVARIYSGFDKSVLRTYEGEDTTDEFGTTCAVIGDVDGDGTSDHLIGAARAP